MAAIFSYLAESLGSRRNIEAQQALKFVAGAGVLGVLADVLFHGAGAGVNIVVWHAALLTLILAVATISGARLRLGQLAILAASFSLTATAAWRDADTLVALNLVSSFFLVVLALTPSPRASFSQAEVLEFCLALASSLMSIGVAAYRLLAALPWPAPADSRAREQAVSLGWGLFVAVPLVLVFGGLFVSADAVFESKAKAALSLDISGVAVHAAWVIAGAWWAAGCCWLVSRPATAEPPAMDMPDAFRLRPLATAIILGSLAVLFAAFVLVQVNYLFGGRNVVLDSLHLTYSQYARRGFFELVTAASLLLPVLLGINWARSHSTSSFRIFHALAFALILLLFVVMASALKRLDVYKEAYGLTELRLYAVAILAWLGLVFCWFAGTVLPGRSGRFLPGALLLAVVVLAGLAFSSPDDLIARTNTDRIRAARPFDAAHASGLSADAVSALVSRLDRMSSEDRCVIARSLQSKWAPASGDLRSWNWARERARKAVIDHRSELEAACA